MHFSKRALILLPAIQVQVLIWTGDSGSSPDMDRRFRFKDWYGPAIQVQGLIWTGDSGSSPDMDWRFRFKSWYGPAFQVQVLIWTGDSGWSHWAEFKHIFTHTLCLTPKTLVRTNRADFQHIYTQTIGLTLKTLVRTHWTDFQHMCAHNGPDSKNTNMHTQDPTLRHTGARKLGRL
jgi:hypothetical protein